MSNDLSDFTVPPDPYLSALVTGSLAIAGAVPVLGGPVSAAISGTIAHRQAVRQVEFVNLVVNRLHNLESKVNGLSPESLLASDEFISAFTAAEAGAAAAVREAKRDRIAIVLAQMGPWGPFNDTKRARVLAVVLRYEDLHIDLLRFFHQPETWIRRGTPTFRSEAGGLSSIEQVLIRYMFPGHIDWQEDLYSTLADLQRDGLAQTVDLQTTMSSQGTLQPRTTSRGEQFLTMLEDETDT